MKIYLPCILFLCIFHLSVTSLNGSADTTDQKQVIVVAVLKNWPPQYLTDIKTGKPSGFGVEIFERIAATSGLKIQYKVYDSWPEIFMAAKEEQIDLIPNMGITEERFNDFDFTAPYETFKISIFVRDAPTLIQGINDLIDAKIAVVKDNKALYILEQNGAKNLSIYESLEEAFFSLLSGSVDAFVYPEPVVWNLADQSGLTNRIKTIDTPILEVKRGIAVRKGLPALTSRLDAAVRDFINGPEYMRIYKKWNRTTPPYWNIQRLSIFFGIILAVILIALILWRYATIMRLNKIISANLNQLEQTEMKLRKSLQESSFLSTILEQSSQPFAVGYPDGGLKTTNRAFCDLTGYTHDELISNINWNKDLTPEEWREEELLAIKRIYETGTPQRYEKEYIRKDGSRFLAEILANQILNQKGEVEYLYAFVTDITEHKKLDDTIRKQKYYLEKAQELGKMGTWELDLRQNKLYWTDENCRIFGVPPGSVVNYEIFLEKVHPDDREYVDHEWKAAIKGKEYDIEHRLLIDGETTWVREKADVAFNADGVAVSAIGFTQDITKRRQAEEELKKHRDHLEEMVQERTEKLQQTINLMVGRENRMAELKNTIEKLREQLRKAGIKPVADDPLKEKLSSKG